MYISMLCSSLVFIFLSMISVKAEFSASFNSWMRSTYGPGLNDILARRDIGAVGSFGGGTHDGKSRTKKQAVVMVHGITNNAHTFGGIRQKLFASGYSDDTVYGTTYGDSGKTAAPMVDMKCDYVKRVRWMIQATAAFTRRRVDVIGYSMGSPVARKAILGGACTDTGENLGPSLTGLVDTFISVAGANRGSFLCLLPFPGACNLTNGLSCHSRFIQDINSRQRYEGRHIYSIHSRSDDKVGHMNACGQPVSNIAGSDREIEQSGNHDQVLMDTAAVQISLLGP